MLSTNQKIGWTRTELQKFAEYYGLECETMIMADDAMCCRNGKVQRKIGGNSMNYPVSEKKCARCSACQLVTKDISGAPLEEKKMYYQCIAMAECYCGEQEEK